MTEYVITRWYRPPELILVRRSRLTHPRSHSCSSTRSTHRKSPLLRDRCMRRQGPATRRSTCGVLGASWESFLCVSRYVKTTAGQFWSGFVLCWFGSWFCWSCFCCSAIAGAGPFGYSSLMTAGRMRLTQIFPGRDYVDQIKVILSRSAHHLRKTRRLLQTRKLGITSKAWVISEAALGLLAPGCHRRILDILDQILQFDPAKRLSAADCLAHPWLEEHHDPSDEIEHPCSTAFV